MHANLGTLRYNLLPALSDTFKQKLKTHLMLGQRRT